MATIAAAVIAAVVAVGSAKTKSDKEQAAKNGSTAAQYVENQNAEANALIKVQGNANQLPPLMMGGPMGMMGGPGTGTQQQQGGLPFDAKPVPGGPPPDEEKPF